MEKEEKEIDENEIIKMYGRNARAVLKIISKKKSDNFRDDTENDL